jgi:hypothetical protein
MRYFGIAPGERARHERIKNKITKRNAEDDREEEN